MSLRLRLMLGMLAVAFIATAGFALAMHQFVEVLEDELLDQSVLRELDSITMEYRAGADIAGKRGQSGHVYLVSPGAPSAALPHALIDLRAGDDREDHIGGREVFVARRDVEGAAIYYTLNVAPVDELENRLAAIGWTTLAGAIAVSLIIALIFSYLILRPVRALSARLSAYRPEQVNAPIVQDYTDREMRVITQSFDELIARFHAFIERERSFTEDAGHELRTPLAVALSANELLLQQTDLSPRTRERAHRTQAACLRMQRLVGALLFLGRDRPAQVDHCDIAVILDEVMPYYLPLIERKRLNLEIESTSTPVPAPAGIVDCVLHNLLENAVEHTRSGFIHVSVDAQRLIIADSGEGIAAEAIEHIFGRRYRSANSRGFGIGLYLVKRICTRLGWPISVSSSADAGTRFEIDLVANRCAPGESGQRPVAYSRV